ncbi:hypothetical protein CN070_12790 [Sinorhizobium meliloti]|nr:hypothetical protein CN070_12790 [Sinorhizobium meliloti]
MKVVFAAFAPHPNPFPAGGERGRTCFWPGRLKQTTTVSPLPARGERARVRGRMLRSIAA